MSDAMHSARSKQRPDPHADWCKRFDVALAAMVEATKQPEPMRLDGTIESMTLDEAERYARWDEKTQRPLIFGRHVFGVRGVLNRLFRRVDRLWRPS